MFEKDIIAWALAERDGQVMEVHLLKDRSVLTGPWLRKSRWERGQRRMLRPYPEKIRVPVDVIVAECDRQERLAGAQGVGR